MKEYLHQNVNWLIFTLKLDDVINLSSGVRHLQGRLMGRKSTKTQIYLESNIGLIKSWMGLKSSSELSNDIKPVIGINFRFKPITLHYLWNFLIGIHYSTNNFKGDFKNSLLNSDVAIGINFTRNHCCSSWFAFIRFSN